MPSGPNSEPQDGVTRAPLLDASVLIGALAGPWLFASDPWARVGLGALALVVWFALVRPGWRGLLHFYGTITLGLALATLAGIALFG